MADVIHIITIAEELQRIFDADLKTSLNLQSVMLGKLEWLPPTAITGLVNGIWINTAPAMTNDPSELPRQLLQKYNFRIVYVRRMAINENPTKKAMEDAKVIGNKLIDKISLPDITNMPSTAMVLWIMPRSFEWEPPEDDYVGRIAADLTAMAINLEVMVRTRR